LGFRCGNKITPIRLLLLKLYFISNYNLFRLGISDDGKGSFIEMKGLHQQRGCRSEFRWRPSAAI
jgi:hypothetical protein